MTASLIRNQKEKLADALNNAASIGIIIGQEQNVDTVGAALGLSLLLLSDGKNVQVVSKREPTVEVSNLFGINKVSKSFEGQVKVLTISVPYREGEIEKVSYNIEGDRLNVNLFADGPTGISFKESDVDYIRKGSAPSLIITVGVQDESELASFVDPRSVKTIHIDRSPLNTLTGDITLIDPSASSVSEIIAQMVMDLSFGVDPDAFQNLMDGITYATRNFTLPQTSPFAFEAAGFLLQNGARRKEKTVGGRDLSAVRSDLDRAVRPQPAAPSGAVAPRFPGANQPQPSARPISGGFQKPSRPRNFPPPPPPASGNFPPQGAPAGDQFEDDSDVISRQNITKASGEAENPMNEEIPEDWFLPKVFKGSRKGN